MLSVTLGAKLSDAKAASAKSCPIAFVFVPCWQNITKSASSTSCPAAFCSLVYQKMAASSPSHPALRLNPRLVRLPWPGKGEGAQMLWPSRDVFPGAVNSELPSLFLPVFHLLPLIKNHQRGSVELLLAASANATAATLPAALHPLLPAGGALGRQVLGAHVAAQQAARPVAAQLSGSAGVSLSNPHTANTRSGGDGLKKCGSGV